MSHIQFTDELVREYLLFRGFGGALKALDADLKSDKDKGFRVDKIVDQIVSHVSNYDLTGLREIWSHLDSRLFTRLEQNFTGAIRKLENAVLKFYLVNAWENNKQEKITEFFSKLTTDLINQPEWRDWFVFPFIKNPEDHAVFSIYFTKQWQDTLLVSLHNFLAAVYQCMPLPTLSSFEENASKMMSLQKENDIIRKGLINLIHDQEKIIGAEQCSVQGFDEIMDDFYNISQEIKENESQAKLLKTIMKNIGSMPPSPKSESREQTVRNSHRKNCGKKITQTKRSLSIDARRTNLKPRERDSSLDLTSARTSRESSQKKGEVGEKAEKGNFLFLSREEYSEHKCLITSIKFNTRGNLVASADKEGNLRIWSVSPSCKTLASFPNKFLIVCLDWVPSHERYVVSGTNNGVINLYDTKEVKSMWSISLEGEESLPSVVEDISSSPSDPVIVAVASGKPFVIDLRARKIEKCLNTREQASSAKIIHGGQLVLVGTRQGSVLLMNIRNNEVVDRWTQEPSPVHQIEVSHDFNAVFTLTKDKIHCKYLNHPKNKELTINMPKEMKIHPERHGRLFCLDSSGTLILTIGINSGVIYKVEEDRSLVKSLELGGHKTMLTCVDWSFANQCATCVTASQDGTVKISTLLLNSL